MKRERLACYPAAIALAISACAPDKLTEPQASRVSANVAYHEAYTVFGTSLPDQRLRFGVNIKPGTQEPYKAMPESLIVGVSRFAGASLVRMEAYCTPPAYSSIRDPEKLVSFLNRAAADWIDVLIVLPNPLKGALGEIPVGQEFTYGQNCVAALSAIVPQEARPRVIALELGNEWDNDAILRDDLGGDVQEHFDLAKASRFREIYKGMRTAAQLHFPSALRLHSTASSHTYWAQYFLAGTGNSATSGAPTTFNALNGDALAWHWYATSSPGSPLQFQFIDEARWPGFNGLSLLQRLNAIRTSRSSGPWDVWVTEYALELPPVYTAPCGVASSQRVEEARMLAALSRNFHNASPPSQGVRVRAAFAFQLMELNGLGSSNEERYGLMTTCDNSFTTPLLSYPAVDSLRSSIDSLGGGRGYLGLSTFLALCDCTVAQPSEVGRIEAIARAVSNSDALVAQIDAQLGRSRWLRSLYQRALGRDADPDGHAHWLGLMQLTSEWPRRRVEAEFVASQENWERSGQNTAEWVRNVYRAVLGREPDVDGLSFWEGQLASGWSRFSVVWTIQETAEARERLGANAHAAMAGSPANVSQLQSLVSQLYFQWPGYLEMVRYLATTHQVRRSVATRWRLHFQP